MRKLRLLEVRNWFSHIISKWKVRIQTQLGLQNPDLHHPSWLGPRYNFWLILVDERTASLTHSLIHSITQSLTHSLIHWTDTAFILCPGFCEWLNRLNQPKTTATNCSLAKSGSMIYLRGCTQRSHKVYHQRRRESFRIGGKGGV